MERTCKVDGNPCEDIMPSGHGSLFRIGGHVMPLRIQARKIKDGFLRLRSGQVFFFSEQFFFCVIIDFKHSRFGLESSKSFCIWPWVSIGCRLQLEIFPFPDFANLV